MSAMKLSSLQSISLVTVNVLLSALLLFEQRGAVSAIGGCREAQLCCLQKDNKCRVSGQRMNARNNSKINAISGTCFCDAGCVELNDCCTDYRHHCAVVDCELSNTWSDWGECSVLCGLGVKERHRRIVRYQQNGGKPCQPNEMVQRAVCEGITCKLPRALSPAILQQLREIGRIVPLSFARWRQSQTYNPYAGARKHLFDESRRAAETYTSCATYEITSNRSPCLKPLPSNSWIKMLRPSAEVCVECQVSASSKMSSSSSDDVCRGRGVFNRETRWSAMTAPGCHGTWIMKTRWQRCSCASSGGKTVAPSFVFV